MAKLRAAVVGLGFGKQVHVPALLCDDRCDVVAVCGTNASKARRAAADLGILQSTDDWRELVDDQSIDLITLAVPPSVQVEVAAAALARGMAVFCEKPLAPTIVEADRLAETARNLGLPNLVNFEFPEDVVWRRALQIAHDGALGRVRHLSVQWQVLTYGNRIRRDDWKAHAAAGGAALGGFVSHVFDYLERFAGPVSRMLAQVRCEPDDPRPGETLVELWLQFAGGAVGSVSVNTDAGPGNLHRVAVFGDAGGLELFNDTSDYLRGFRLRHGTRAEGRTMNDVNVPGAVGDAPIDGRIAATSQLLRKLIDWRLGGPPVEPTFTQGARVQRLIDAARRSSDAAAWVDV